VPAYDLSGKVALVTGGARGIGFAAARQLHGRGASVAVVDLDPAQAREAAERIGTRAIGIGADVVDEGAVMAAVAATVERFGGLDVAVANAGIAPPTVTTARTMPPEQFRRVLDINLLGAWHTARAALPQVVERRGQLIFIGSIYSHANGLLASPYAVSKAGVEALGRALRAELAPLGASAGVVYFGWVDTDLVRDSLDRRDDGFGARVLSEILPGFLLRRISPDTAGAAIVRALEQRSPRLFAPSVWRYIAALRGLLSPVLDRRLESDARVAAIVAEAEAAATRRSSSVPGPR
jgi:NAD(P)-dependent dehydrogenase (short-subunit alcohol dehydrogenase family)